MPIGGPDNGESSSAPGSVLELRGQKTGIKRRSDPFARARHSHRFQTKKSARVGRWRVKNFEKSAHIAIFPQLR